MTVSITEDHRQKFLDFFKNNNIDPDSGNFKTKHNTITEKEKDTIWNVWAYIQDIETINSVVLANAFTKIDSCDRWRKKGIMPNNAE